MKKMIGIYHSKLGTIVIEIQKESLKRVWFDDQNEFRGYQEPENVKTLPVMKQTKKWLEDYFQGKNPANAPSIRLSGTDFQKEIWEYLREIPYGEVVTYGDLAKKYAKKHGKEKMSAQAVGNAVGKNPIPIFVPCHRVIGKNGKLVGFGCGLERKAGLLQIEKHSICEDKIVNLL